jgi:FkbM family methyltransferase
MRLRNYHVRERAGQLRADGILSLRLKRPFVADISLRERGSDLATFHEIAEEEVYAPVLKAVEAFQTVIDLGANIGLASLYLAHNSPTCRILCVEPNCESYELLVRNVHKLNRSGRCRTLKAAVWGTHQRLAPNHKAPPDRYSMFTVRVASANEPSAVEGYTMTEILDYSGFDRVDLLKVDIEGAERELFSTQDLSWLARVGAIAIEFHEDSRNACGFDDKMTRNGFEICTEHSHTILARKPRWDWHGSAKAHSLQGYATAAVQALPSRGDGHGNNSGVERRG